MTTTQRSLMTEKDLQTAVTAIADLYGWLSFHDHDSRRNRAGFPDLVLLHPLTGRLLFRELKTEKGRVRPEQQGWLDALILGNHDAAIWRPRHLHDGTITAALQAGGGGRG